MNAEKEDRIPDQVQHNPGALLVGGGLKVEAQGKIIGGIGVSGAPRVNQKKMVLMVPAHKLG